MFVRLAFIQCMVQMVIKATLIIIIQRVKPFIIKDGSGVGTVSSATGKMFCDRNIEYFAS